MGADRLENSFCRIKCTKMFKTIQMSKISLTASDIFAYFHEACQ